MNTDVQCDYSVSETIQGQSLPLSAIIDQYIRTGVAPAPLPLSTMEFNRDLSDSEMDSLDGHKLDHDLSELDASKENLINANDRFSKVKALYDAEQASKTSE